MDLYTGTFGWDQCLKGTYSGFEMGFLTGIFDF